MSARPLTDARRLAGAAAAARRDDAFVVTHRAFQTARLAYLLDPNADTWERMEAARRQFLETWGVHAA